MPFDPDQTYDVGYVHPTHKIIKRDPRRGYWYSPKYGYWDCPNPEYTPKGISKRHHQRKVKLLQKIHYALIEDLD